MNREIKFRCWDITNKKWQDVLVGNPLDFKQWTVMHDFDFQQYTGLKDKNGKEIYEGDIIRIDNGNHIEEIKWITEKDWFDISKTNPCPFVGFVNYYNVYKTKLEIEIIGNVWENPEILN